MKFEHEPVLVREAIENLNIKKDGIYVDCTVGGGGHSLEIAKRIYPSGRLIGIDRDPEAIKAARSKLAPYREIVDLFVTNYRELKNTFSFLNIKGAHGILFDLGVSSYQLDNPHRGFSYMKEAPLDMRMGESKMTVAELVNSLGEKELENILWNYGEERWARRIASFIVAERKKKPLSTTLDLVSVIKAAIPRKARLRGPHPAKRTFQALRIAVNNELENLERALEEATELLFPGGRLVVISFHSLEDRIVKQLFKKLSMSCCCPPGQPVCTCSAAPVLKIITKKPIIPTSDEVVNNPRSRSAKMRVAEKME